MKELLSAFSFLGVRQVAAVLFGLVRSKVVASYLGPAGTGVVAQGTTLMRLFQQLSAMGVGSGFTKLIAQYRTQGDKEKVNIVVSTVMGFFGLVGLIVLLLSYIFSTELSLYIFDNEEYSWFVIIIAAAGWIFVQYNFILTIFRAMFKWRQYSVISVIGYALNIFTTVFLVIRFDILGAVVSIFVAQVTNFVISLIMFHKHIVIPEELKFWQYRPTKEMLLIVIRFIGPLSVATIIPVVSLIYVRSEIIRQFGVDANGIFQVVWGISVTYMGLILISLNSYGVPKVATLLDKPDEIRKVQNHEIRLGIFVVTPILIMLAAYREIWIPILYSVEFLSAGSILIWQFGADFFRIFRHAINITLVPRERFKFIYWDAIFLWGGWMLFTYFFMPILGLVAVPLGYFAINLIEAAISFAYQTLKMGFEITARNKSLALQSMLIAGVAISLFQFTEGFLVRTVIFAISLLAIALWIPTKQEQKDLFGFAKEVFGKRGRIDDLD